MVTAPTGERAIVFECGGERLLGVLSPAIGEGTLGLLILVGGPQYRVGSHRQFLLLARRLAQSNISVMRFDYRGMGDSSGDMRSFEDVTPDIAAAITAFKTAVPSVERIVLWGLCDAASGSLLYWYDTQDQRIAGMVLADPWITSHGEFAKSQLRHYIARPFQREFWKKLFAGGIDVSGALRDFVAVISRTRNETAAQISTPQMSFQEKMTRAMDSFGGPLLLLLSGDLTARDFRRHCETHPQWRRLIEKSNIARAEVPEANHTFASSASRRQVEELTLDWLEKKVRV